MKRRLPLLLLVALVCVGVCALVLFLFCFCWLLVLLGGGASLGSFAKRVGRTLVTSWGHSSAIASKSPTPWECLFPNFLEGHDQMLKALSHVCPWQKRWGSHAKCRGGGYW